MDITTIVGFIAGFTLLVMGILSGGDMAMFIDVPSVLITAGGSLAAFLVSATLVEANKCVGWVMYVFFWPRRIYANVHPDMFEELNRKRPAPASDEEVARVRFDLQRGAEILRRVQHYPIRFGLIGTLVGVTNMLHHLDDPAAIGPGVATAILTVFYGVILSYLVIMPMASKLEARLRSLDEKFWR